MAYVFGMLSILAFGFAGCVALQLMRDRAEARDRIARAVRPVHGKSLRAAPMRVVNRPGEN